MAGRRVRTSSKYSLVSILKAPAVLDEGIDDGGFFSGVLGTDEEPVLGSEFGRPDGVLNEVVVDLDTAVAQIGLEVGPLVEGVGDGFA